MNFPMINSKGVLQIGNGSCYGDSYIGSIVAEIFKLRYNDY